MPSALTYYMFAFAFGIVGAGLLYLGCVMRRTALQKGRRAALPVCFIAAGFQFALCGIACFAPVVAIWVMQAQT